jgi:hypothetical protein
MKIELCKEKVVGAFLASGHSVDVALGLLAIMAEQLGEIKDVGLLWIFLNAWWPKRGGRVGEACAEALLSTERGVDFVLLLAQMNAEKAAAQDGSIFKEMKEAAERKKLMSIGGLQKEAQHASKRAL